MALSFLTVSAHNSPGLTGSPLTKRPQRQLALSARGLRTAPRIDGKPFEKPTASLRPVLTRTKKPSDPMTKKPQHHLKGANGLSVCGVTSRWPDRAVVNKDLFTILAKKYNTQTCPRCRASADASQGAVV